MAPVGVIGEGWNYVEQAVETGLTRGATAFMARQLFFTLLASSSIYCSGLAACMFKVEQPRVSQWSSSIIASVDLSTLPDEANLG